MLKHLLLLLTAFLLAAGCGQRPSEPLEINLDDTDIGELQISSETINEIIQNIASPIEVPALIQELNVPYSNQYLADPETISGSTNSTDMAYALGALCADLGYLNVYNRTGEASNFLSGIKQLADALEIGQFFDHATLNRLAETGSDPDSLMFLSVNSFNNMDDHLRENGRGELSSMLVAGVWVEGLYLSTQVAKQNSNEELTAMIGEQKLILNDLLLILNHYQDDETIAGYIKDLETLKSVFDEVKITYEVGRPQTIERDGMIIVVQSESSHVDMSDETLQKIIGITEQVRNMHLNIKA